MARFSSTYEMTVVVGITAVITQEAHGIALCNVLGVVLHELLGAVPERWDSLDVLVQAQDEAVLLVVLLHEAEGIIVNIAEELDGGLDAPVVVVVQHGFLLEEEARLEATHVAVAHRVAVDDLALGHVLANLAGLFLVNPLGERPMLLRDLAIDRLARDKRGSDLLEGGIERFVVQKDPVIVVAAVEAVLNLTNGTGDVPNVRVAGEGDEGSVHARAGCDAGQLVPARLVRSQGHRPVLRVVGLADLGTVCFRLGCLLRLLGILVLALLLLLLLLLLAVGGSAWILECAILKPYTIVAGMGDEVKNGKALCDDRDVSKLSKHATKR
ncbi:hypothetical protein CTA1_12336 [Colletotrichum tanaceti]|uniref:Uncharacterized protein n=1 Tax=Colletotrichum tanaceti TaxID=1306861 RepID=A0A4U6XII1_9PEZI|nr:hypothetical protein CTA1_12336 [Colletotrichum tanaceti]